MQVRFRLNELHARAFVPTILPKLTICAVLMAAMLLCGSAAQAAQARANDAVTLGNNEQSLDERASTSEAIEASSDVGDVMDSSSPALDLEPDAFDSNGPEHERESAPGVKFQSPPHEARTLGNGDTSDNNDSTVTDSEGALGDKEQKTGLSALRGEISHIVQVVGALFIVFALILLTRFILMRSSGIFGGAGRPSGVLEILARFPIARGQSLVLIKMARRIVLVHQTSTSMTTLTEVSDQDEIASLLSRIEAGASGREQHRFKNILEQFQQEHKRIDHRDPSHIASEQDAEIIDLTRRQSSGLRNWFGGER